MAKSEEKTSLEAKPEETAGQATPKQQEQRPQQEQQQQQQQQQQQRPQVQVDDSRAVTCYANFCRVTGTPEELIIDFGLNTQPVGIPTEKIVITERIVLNYFTAKRMLAALQMSVQRHEAAFGVLETDIQKRVQPSARRPATPPPA